MAVNPVQFLVASNASILDGTKTITISGGVNASRVFSGTAVFLGGADNPAEAVSGTAPDGSGISTITLRNNWTQGDISNQPLVAFNTNEGLAEAISNVREIVSNVSAIEDLATQGLIKRIDDNNYEIVNITSLGESLVGANDAGTARSVLGLGSAATKNVGEAAGNVMEVGAFGVGDSSPDDIGDVTTVTQGGLFKDLGGTTNSADTSAWWGSLLAMPSDTGRGFLHIRHQSPTSLKAWVGRSDADGNNLLWGELFHSDNTNFNEYGSTGAGDILARGYAFSPTGCTFYLPNVADKIPTSLSIIGDFEIADRTTQSLLQPSVTNLVPSARSSPNLVYIDITGLSGFTQGQDLVLRSKVGSSFTVNF